MLQDSPDDKIKVYLRIRPLDEQEYSSNSGSICCRISGDGEVANTVQLLTGATGRGESFSYDCVGGPEITQEQVFRAVGKVITENCMQGYNGTIFAYGQTGAGKTFTMQGPIDPVSGDMNHELRGVIPRCFEYLFAMMSREEKKSGNQVQYLCRASYCEIYNEFIYDLLDPAAPTCNIREDIKRGVYVDGLSEELVTCPADALRLLQTGALNRHVAATSMNRESSRSHSIFTLIIQSKIIDGDIIDVRESRFNLVDLAGSERQKLTATTGLRLKEAGNINKSLLALGNVINALVDIAGGKSRHIHYRDSKLTFLLRDSLGGNAKTFIIANVNSSGSCAAETLSTLRFAKRAKMIRNRAIVNQEFQGNVLQMQEEIKRLRHELLHAQAQQALQPETALIHLEDLVDGDEQESANESHERRLVKLLAASLDRHRRTESERISLSKQLLALQDLVNSQQNQIQSEKMIIKFKESTIGMLRKNQPPGETQKDEEIAALRRIIDSHPEITRFAAENLQLREKLAQFEQMSAELHRLESIHAESRKYEMALADQLIASNEELRAATETLQLLQKTKITDQIMAGSDTFKDILSSTDKLRAEKDEQISELHREISKLRDELEEARQREETTRDELNATECQISQLSSTLDSLQSRQKDAAMMAEQHENLPEYIRVLEQENSKLKVLCETMQRKSRRISDFAAESRTQSKQEVLELQYRIERLQADKDQAELRVTDLLLELSQLQQEQQRLQQVESTNRADVERLQREKCELDEEVVRLENRLIERDQQLESVTESYQSTRVELEDVSGELEISRARLAEIEQQLTERDSAAERLQSDLRNAVDRVAQRDEEIGRLQSVLRDANTSSQELTAALNQVTCLSTNVAEKDRLIDEQMKSLETVRIQLKSLQDEDDRLKVEMEQERSTMADMLQRYKEERGEVQKLKASLQQTLSGCLEIKQRSLSILQSTYAEWERQSLIQESSEELEFMKSRLVDLQQKDSNDASDTKTTASESLVASKTDCQVAREHAVHLQDIMEDVKVLTEEFEVAMQRHAEMIASARNRLDTQLSEKNELASELVSVRAELHAISERCLLLKSQAEQSERDHTERIQQLHQECDRLRAEQQRIEACLEMAQEDNQSLLDQIKDLSMADSAKSEQMKTELDAAKNRLDVVNAELKVERDRLQAFADSLSKLAELQGQNKTLEQQFDFLLRRNEELEEANGRLVQHNNHKQKLQYHLQIKQENNQLRMENQRLMLEVEKLGGSMAAVAANAAATATSSTHITRSHSVRR